MRKFHKEQILNTVETLCQACGELVALEGDSLTGLCADMQEFVSAIFDYLNGVQKGRVEELRMQELLQQAYETLYRISCGDAKVGDMVQLCSQLRAAVDSLVADELEVVFFCYKASMSDCFESIYFAAQEDEKCTPYFVPIPYFDRNPDGSFGQMHLEAEGYYSDKYELTDWKTYDVENRRPDAIFIMNPYDGNNYVTSVHPNFYSKRLREFTDKLVYIEYGLPLWLHREPEKEAEELKKNGIILPGHVYCHYYVAYAQELVDLFRIYFDASKSEQDKFIALGSPKLDKVINARREDYTIPEEWEEKIRNRKVVLFNCSLGELLKSCKPDESGAGKQNAYFNKVREIIGAFNGRDDVVIWWRPHPLFKSTLQSMRPELLEEYHQILEEFHTLENGIFDETQDLHRSIVWSDAMISDESSLLLLYMATGKFFWIPAITKALNGVKRNDERDFHAPLDAKIKIMRAAVNRQWPWMNRYCVWWDVFLEDERAYKIKFERFVERFLEFVTTCEEYPETEEYRNLQLQIFKDYVVNPDGTAGKKIYDFVKFRVCGKEDA